jgi:hypothetical protein
MNYEKSRFNLHRFLPSGQAEGIYNKPQMAAVALTDAELATVSGGAGPNVAVLPYLFENTQQIHITYGPLYPPAPPACNCTSLFGSLLGGGFKQVIIEAVVTYYASVTVIAFFSGFDDALSALLLIAAL